MPFQHSQRNPHHPKILLVSLICVWLAGCSGAKSTATRQLTVTPDPTISASSAAPTVAPTIPVISSSTVKSPLSATSGLVVLSLGDGLYTHLFLFDPATAASTRLTANDWDDEDPALSPDGSKMAFSSNRNGEWDIYILDLHSGDVRRLTQSKTYDGSPCWSPDGQYLIYQTLDGQNLDLVVQAVNDASAAPIQLTANAGDNFDPSWSPDGHTIAFITNRDGQSEVWLANLQSVDNRFTQLMSTDQTQYRYPRWSPDGSMLAWCRQDSESSIEVLSPSQSNSLPHKVGLGCQPVWSADGTSILATLDQPNTHYLVGYRLADGSLLLAPTQMAAQVQSIDWASASQSLYISNYANLQTLPTPTALFTPTLSLPAASDGRQGVVALKNVTVPQPYLADSTDEAFIALRQGIGQKSGWDFLASLEEAYLPLTSSDAPAITQDWLYTGRAIDVNTVPIDAGWMAVSREDFSGQTYWRVWIKCLDQSGACGQPMLTAPWNFSSRFDSDPVAYENGGKLAAIPAGYWLDFTEFAGRYGWERVPSQADWRYYYPGILFNQFVYAQGLDWQQAMLQLYPASALTSLSTNK